MRKYLAAFTFIALAVLLARPAAAQGDEFYGGIGVGYGAYDLSASGYSLPSDFKNDIAFYGEFGYRVSHAFALGVEADYYSKGSNGTTFKVWYYNVAAAFYPLSASQLWIKVLAGYANTTGFGGGGLTIVPFAQYVAQLSSAKFPTTSTDVKSQLFLVGAGIALNH